MIDVEVKNPSDRAVVKISGGLNVLHASKLKETLIEALDTCKSVEIHIDSMENIDLSSIQLFCAAHKTALSLNKELIVAGAIPAVIRQIVIGSGYARRIGCNRDKNQGCMWIKEANR